MLSKSFKQQLKQTLLQIDEQQGYQHERLISGPQADEIAVAASTGKVLNLCSSNYLGFANSPELIDAAKNALDRFGLGTASARFICGTQTLHRQLEQTVAKWLMFDDAILYPAGFNANLGVFAPLLGPEDAIVFDDSSHASIVDGIRLCLARHYRYENSNIDDLRRQLESARADGARNILIATDGVFSMDGSQAKLPSICDLADQFAALVMVDDCHGTGILGPEGRGTAVLQGCGDRIDLLTGTFGKALGGSTGGFACANEPIVDLLRQRSRPYLFSNSPAPALCGAAIRAVQIAQSSTGNQLRQQLLENAMLFREKITSAGFAVSPAEHPIIAVVLGESAVAKSMADQLLKRGIYVVGFQPPMVPEGQARIRIQVSAIHNAAQIEAAVEAFIDVGKQLKII